MSPAKINYTKTFNKEKKNITPDDNEPSVLNDGEW